MKENNLKWQLELWGPEAYVCPTLPFKALVINARHIRQVFASQSRQLVIVVVAVVVLFMFNPFNS